MVIADGVLDPRLGCVLILDHSRVLLFYWSKLDENAHKCNKTDAYVHTDTIYDPVDSWDWLLMLLLLLVSSWSCSGLPGPAAKSRGSRVLCGNTWFMGLSVTIRYTWGCLAYVGESFA